MVSGKRQRLVGDKDMLYHWGQWKRCLPTALRWRRGGVGQRAESGSGWLGSKRGLGPRAWAPLAQREPKGGYLPAPLGEGWALVLRLMSHMHYSLSLHLPFWE